jgi:hypothetical protein
MRQRQRAVSVTKPDIGLVRHAPYEQLKPGSLIDGLNFRIMPGRIEKAKGWTKFTSYALAKLCMLLDVAGFDDGTSILIASTDDEIYKYNTSSTNWDKITASTLTGGTTVPYSSCMFKNLWIFTNRTDAILKWTGSGNTAALGGLSDCEPGAVVISTCRSLCSAGPFLFIVAPVEDGGSKPLRIRWNKFNEPEIWKNDVDGNGQAGYLDINENADQMVVVASLGNYFVAYKERSIHLLSYLGEPVIWGRRQVISGKGLISPRSFVSLGDFHVCAMTDNFYIFNGASLQPIGNPVREEFFDGLSPTKKDLMFGFHIEEVGEVVFAYPGLSASYPDRALVYNYVTNAWSFRDFPFIAATLFLNQSATTWADLVGDWTVQGWNWDTRTFLASAQVPIVAGENTYVYKYGETDAKDGADLNGYVTSTLTDFGYPDRMKRAFRLKVANNYVGTTMTIYIMTADKPKGDITYNGPFTLDLSDENMFLDFDYTARYFGVKFQTQLMDEPFTISGWSWQFSLEEDS